ncbi:MAG: hypothetical protein LUD81_05695 [Clostridiales bacterium]|nr:hypothetical protein [Clostridiales bacterium]
MADYSSDISNLPTSTSRGTQGESKLRVNAECLPGSTCRVAEDSSVWILNNQNEWVEQESSGGGSGGDYSLTAITTDEIDEMFDEE